MKKDVCRYHSEKPEGIGGLRVYGCCHARIGDTTLMAVVRFNGMFLRDTNLASLYLDIVL